MFRATGHAGLRGVLIAVGLAVSLIAAACGASETDQPGDSAPVDGGPVASEMVAGQNIAKSNDPGVSTEVAFTVDSRGFAGPESTPSGWTRIVLRNQGQADHHMGLVRLNGGKTVADLKAFIEEEPKARFPDWAIPSGGPGDVAPGATMSVTQDLAEGSYALISYVPDDDDIARPSVEKLRPLQVTAGGPPGTEPTHDVVLDIVDYDFRIRNTGNRFDNFGMSVNSGSRIIKVTNLGEHSHEARIVEIVDGKQAQGFPDLYEMRKELYGGSVSGSSARFSPFPVIKENGRGPGGPPPGTAVGGVMALAPGQSVYITADLKGAWHFIYDNLEDVEFQAPYLLRPMVREFPVR